MGHPTMQENDTAKLTPTYYIYIYTGFQVNIINNSQD